MGSEGKPYVMTTKVHPEGSDAAAEEDKWPPARPPASPSPPRHATREQLCDKALGCLAPDNGLRQFFVKLTRAPAFDMVIINVVGDFTNSWVFGPVFLIEMVCKIFALGFYSEGPHTYLKNNWNILDFVCVMSWIGAQAVPSLSALQSLKMFRLLRPLKSLSKFQGLRRIVVTFMAAFDGLAVTVTLLTFLLFVVSIACMQFFKGALHFRCRITPYPTRVPDTWYRPCVRRRFDAYRELMLRIDYGYRTVGYDAMLANCSSVEGLCGALDAGDDYNWQSWDSKDTWACATATFPGPAGIPVTDTYAHKYAEGDLNGDDGKHPWQSSKRCLWLIDEDDGRPCAAKANEIFGLGGLHKCYENGRQQRSGYVLAGDYSGDDGVYPPVDDRGDGWPSYEVVVAGTHGPGWAPRSDANDDPVFPENLFAVGSMLVLNLVLGVIADTLGDEEDAEAEEEAEAAALALASGGVKLAKGEEEDDADIIARMRATIPGPPPRLMLFDFVTSDMFNNFIYLCIGLNTVALCLDDYPRDEEWSNFMEVSNLVLAFVFIVEMVLKLVALGWANYASDTFNLFDFTIVWVSIITMILAASDAGFGGGAISAFRCFRVFRIFKLFKSWQSLQVLLATMAETAKEIGNFLVLLMLMVFIFGLLGMQLFANQLRFDDDTGAKVAFGVCDGMIEDGACVQQAGVCDSAKGECKLDPAYSDLDPVDLNFDDFMSSMITVFGVLTGESWNLVMYDLMRGRDNVYYGVFYMMLTIIILAFFVMNMFLAILLSKFEDNEELSQPAPREESLRKLKSFRQVAKAVNILKKGTEDDPGDSDAKELTPFQIAALKAKKKKDPEDVEAAVHPPKTEPKPKETAPPKEKPNLDFTIVMISIVTFLGDLGVPLGVDVKVFKVLRAFRVFRPLRMLSRYPGLRLVLNSLLVAIPAAFNVVVVCILFMSIFAILGVGFFKGQMNMCDVDTYGGGIPEQYFDTIARVIEDPIHLKKAVKSGAFEEFHNASMAMYGYGTQCWVSWDVKWVNGHDYFNTHSTVISDFQHDWETSGRPGVISSKFSHAPGDLEKAEYGISPPTKSYFTANPWLTDGSDVPQAFLDHVADVPATGNLDKYIPTSKDMCKCMFKDENAWSNPLYMSFDNFDTAFALLFEIYSTEGWLDYMYYNVDANGIEMQPIRDHGFREQRRSLPRFYSFFYHVLFQFVGGFFAMQLFVGVIIEQFGKLKEQAEQEGRKGVMMTASQEQWVKTQKFIIEMVKPKHKIKPVNVPCYNIVEGEHKATFENFIMACIVINGLFMGLDHFGQPQGMTVAIELINMMFAIIFNIEAILKILGIGWTNYWVEAWNRFDFLIVIGTDLGYFISWVTPSDIGGVASVVRLFRIARIFRLFNSAKTMKTLIMTLMSALPQMGNVGLVLMIFIGIWAILLVELFAGLSYGETVHPNANFQHVPIAILTLIRFTTGENWNGFMHDMNFKWRGASGCWGGAQFEKIRTKMYDAEPGAYWQDKWCTRLDGGDRETCQCASFHTHGLDGGQKKDMCQEFVSYENCCVPLSACGDKWWAGAIIHIFDIIVTGVVLNLFVGIILSAYEDEEEEEGLGLSETDLANFVEDWSRFDEHASWHIKLKELKELIQILDEPMGFGGEEIVENDVGESRLHMFDVATALGKRLVAKAHGGDESLDTVETAPNTEFSADATPYLEKFFGKTAADIERSSPRPLHVPGSGLAEKPAEPEPAPQEAPSPVYEMPPAGEPAAPAADAQLAPAAPPPTAVQVQLSCNLQGVSGLPIWPPQNSKMAATLPPDGYVMLNDHDSVASVHYDARRVVEVDRQERRRSSELSGLSGEDSRDGKTSHGSIASVEGHQRRSDSLASIADSIADSLCDERRPSLGAARPGRLVKVPSDANLDDGVDACTAFSPVVPSPTHRSSADGWAEMRPRGRSSRDSESSLSPPKPGTARARGARATLARRRLPEPRRRAKLARRRRPEPRAAGRREPGAVAAEAARPVRPAEAVDEAAEPPRSSGPRRAASPSGPRR
ncbi:hypothetical protein JL720_2422 [Aureococcus anophagefferens]|nr:hypothetical protein JL720_2422 [Aureococcus anophagefferens]